MTVTWTVDPSTVARGRMRTWTWQWSPLQESKAEERGRSAALHRRRIRSLNPVPASISAQDHPTKFATLYERGEGMLSGTHLHPETEIIEAKRELLDRFVSNDLVAPALDSSPEPAASSSVCGASVCSPSTSQERTLCCSRLMGGRTVKTQEMVAIISGHWLDIHLFSTERIAHDEVEWVLHLDVGLQPRTTARFRAQL